MLCDQIFERMRAGEKLRWVPRSLSRQPLHGEPEQVRDLFLGAEKLDQQSEFLVAMLECDGELVSTEDSADSSGCSDYSFAAKTEPTTADDASPGEKGGG